MAIMSTDARSEAGDSAGTAGGPITCPHCGGVVEIVADVAGGLVCTGCGAVVDGVLLHADVDFEDNNVVGVRVGQHSTGVSARRQFVPTLLKNGTVARRSFRAVSGEDRAHGALRRLVVSMGLGVRISEQAHSLFRALISVGFFRRFGKAGRVAGAACVYVAARQNKVPVTMMEIADSIHCNVFELGRVFSRIMRHAGLSVPEHDPAVFIESFVAAALPDAAVDERMAVGKHAARILTFSKERWLDTGRRPSCLAAAAVALAIDISAGATAAGSRRSRVKGISAVSSIGGISVTGVRARYGELADLLTAKCQLLPWGADISRSNVLAHGASLLDNADLIMAAYGSGERPSHETPMIEHPSMLALQAPQPAALVDGSAERRESGDAIPNPDPPSIRPPSALSGCPATPPAYVRCDMERRRRIEKLKRAKERLKATLGEAAAGLSVGAHEMPASAMEALSERDTEDLVVERLLLAGKDDEFILQYRTRDAHSLADLLWSQREASSRNSPALTDDPVYDAPLSDSELCDEDMPDDELRSYVLSSAEILAMEHLRSKLEHGFECGDASHEDNNGDAHRNSDVDCDSGVQNSRAVPKRRREGGEKRCGKRAAVAHT